MNTVTISTEEYNHLKDVKNIDNELKEIKSILKDFLKTTQAEAKRIDPSDTKRIFDDYVKRRQEQKAASANQ